MPAAARAQLERKLGTDLSDVRIHRDEETATAARELSARAFTAGGEVHIPAHHGALEGPTARSILAHELTHVAQQRRYGSSLPPEDTAEGQRLEHDARGMEGSLTSTLPSHAAHTDEHAVQTIFVPYGPSQGSDHPHDEPALPRPHTVQRQAQTPAASAPSSRAQPDIEEMAGRVYEQVRARLRSELLIDRERAGLLVDLK